VLEIVAGPDKVNILFASGRIVDAFPPDESPLIGVAARLVEGGVISLDPEGVVSAISESSGEGEEGYKALFLYLNSSGETFVEQEVFRTAVQQTIIDRLYSLKLGNGAYYTFRMQMVDYDRDLSPSISVGQLLLDLVAVEADFGRFESLFGSSGILELSDGDEGNASENEKRLLDAIRTGRSTIKRAQATSLLSRFAFTEALLALHDRGVVVFSPGEMPEEESEDSISPVAEAALNGTAGEEETEELSAVDDLVAALEQSIDESFSESAFADGESADVASAVEHGGEEAEEYEEPEEEYEEGSEDEEYEYEDEYEEYCPDEAQAKLMILNMRLLNASWVPQVVVIVFLAAALLVPVLRWGDAFASFGDIQFLEKRSVVAK
jgi:hypothetical protein